MEKASKNTITMTIKLEGFEEINKQLDTLLDKFKEINKIKHPCVENNINIYPDKNCSNIDTIATELNRKLKTRVAIND